MRKKRFLARTRVLCLLLLLSVAALAQNKTISGKVTDSKDGTPLQGVSVMPKGSVKGTVTGSDGIFHISVPSQTSTLIFSSIGFGLQQVSITGNEMMVPLVATNAALNEVVVIGYGTARKKDLTGSVSTISAKDFQKGSITTPEQLIAGKIPGVSIISNGGSPGSGSTIRIRGGSSLEASNDPLIVIDGVPLDNSTIPGVAAPLSFINPNDIETFTVLKDASSAAIYGTRAANGVIIITTKKGKSGPLRLNLNSVNSLAHITKKVDVLSADEVRAVVNANGTTAQKAMLGTSNTDWQNLIYHTAFSTDNNLSISGGVPHLPYRLSLGWQDQNGVLKTDNLQKTSLGFALDPVLLDGHLKIDLNLKGALEKTRFANQGAIGAAVSFDPTQPVYAKSNRFGGYFEYVDATGTLLQNVGRNPLGLLNEHTNKSSPVRSIGSLQLDYKFPFLPDLHANANLGYDYSLGKGTTFITDSAAESYLAGGQSTQYKQKEFNVLAEFYLNYIKDLSRIKSRIDIMAGTSYNDYLMTVYNYADYTAKGTKVAGTDPQYPFNKPQNKLISFFGRGNYSFMDRYLLTATLRYDGSSRFATDNHWGLFPSAAIAWKMKSESFLQDNRVISDLKLRVGYGVTGQQDGIGDYDYDSYYSLSSANAAYQFGNGFVQGFRPGGFYVNRKWEQTATTNAGVDYGFLDNRITGSVDFYLKKTTNLLNNIPQPAGTNFSAYIVANVGSMENKGVEFNINTQPIRGKELTWDVNFNVAYNKNTITNLTVIPNDPTYIGFPATNITGTQGFAFLDAVGGAKNTFYLYKQVYDPKTGRPIEGLFEDKNRDGIINEDDKYKGHSADPKVFLGFSTNVSYKKWNAGFVLRANLGNYVYNNVLSNTGRLNSIIGSTVLGNASTSYLSTLFKGTTDQQLLSDYYIQNASFLRMDNFNVGYDVGKIDQGHIRLRLNATVQNVFVITKYKGLDPEISNGIDNNFYPRPRTFSLGLNFDF
jgi:TonB-linked SusC/RagA family outer membrane protein